jgi:glycosidase
MVNPDGTTREPDVVAVDEDLLVRYKLLIGIRNRHEALRVGAYRTLVADEGGEVFAFERTHGSERVIVALNSSESASEVVLPEMPASCYRDLLTEETYQAEGRSLTVSLPHKGGVVLTACTDE